MLTFRLALAQSSPPCIPYIGLILQDLTFVQIGNPDKLDGKINFAKRWQQFNILVRMTFMIPKSFAKCPRFIPDVVLFSCEGAALEVLMSVCPCPI